MLPSKPGVCCIPSSLMLVSCQSLVCAMLRRLVNKLRKPEGSRVTVRAGRLGHWTRPDAGSVDARLSAICGNATLPMLMPRLVTGGPRSARRYSHEEPGAASLAPCPNNVPLAHSVATLGTSAASPGQAASVACGTSSGGRCVHDLPTQERRVLGVGGTTIPSSVGDQLVRARDVGVNCRGRVVCGVCDDRRDWARKYN